MKQARTVATWAPPHYECVIISQELVDVEPRPGEDEELQQDVTVLAQQQVSATMEA
jgi:hypothetical protein